MKFIHLILTVVSLASGIGVANAYHQDIVFAILSPMLVATFTHFLNNHQKYLSKKSHKKSKKKGKRFLNKQAWASVLNFILILNQKLRGFVLP